MFIAVVAALGLTGCKRSGATTEAAKFVSGLSQGPGKTLLGGLAACVCMPETGPAIRWWEKITSSAMNAGGNLIPDQLCAHPEWLGSGVTDPAQEQLALSTRSLLLACFQHNNAPLTPAAQALLTPPAAPVSPGVQPAPTGGPVSLSNGSGAKSEAAAPSGYQSYLLVRDKPVVVQGNVVPGGVQYQTLTPGGAAVGGQNLPSALISLTVKDGVQTYLQATSGDPSLLQDSDKCLLSATIQVASAIATEDAAYGYVVLDASAPIASCTLSGGYILLQDFVNVTQIQGG